MDFLIHFFRDILDGPLYWVMVGICFFLILFILGFLVDRHEKKEKLRGLVEAAPAGKDRMHVSDEGTSMTGVQEVITNPIPTQPVVTDNNEQEEKAVSVLELSSEDYQDGAQEVDNNSIN